MDILELEGKCLYQDVPTCETVCPFSLDIREFMRKLQGGQINAAFKQYKKAVKLPGIVSRICDAPCEKACFRKGADAPVAVAALEAACCSNARQKKEDYYIPDKHKKVLVVGSGLSGLFVTVTLANIGYEVDLADRAAAPGGRLRLTDASVLPREILEQELSGALQNSRIHIKTDEEVTSLASGDYDAYVIATGAEGTHIDQRGKSGIFFCGSCVNPAFSITDAVAHTIQVLPDIEAWLRRAKAKPDAQEKKHRYVPDAGQWEKVSPVLTDRSGNYSPEQIEQEASRCTLCTCSACLSACKVLPKYYKDPSKAFLSIHATVNRTDINKKPAQPFIVSCMDCGRCKEVCPEDIDFGEVCVLARSMMVAKNDLPPAYHDYWVRETAFSNVEGSLIRTLNGAATAKYVFFPGCQLSSSDPEYTVRAFRFLKSVYGNDLALMLRCCSLPYHWAGQEESFRTALREMRLEYERLGSPVIITACPNCANVFREYLPHSQVMSLWQVMDEHFDYSVSALPESVFVFDPCAASADLSWAESVRSVLKKAGLAVENADPAASAPYCCGYGGISRIANRTLMETSAGEAALLSGNDYVTYCANCRDNLSEQGKRVYHLLDLLLFDDRERCSRKAPGVSDRRSNKKDVIRMLADEFWGESAPGSRSEKPCQVLFTEAAQAAADRQLMLRDDLTEIVRNALRTKRMMLLDDVYYCYDQVGHSTYHVAFIRKSDTVYEVQSVYSHRSVIVEEGAVHV